MGGKWEPAKKAVAIEASSDPSGGLRLMWRRTAPLYPTSDSHQGQKLAGEGGQFLGRALLLSEPSAGSTARSWGEEKPSPGRELECACGGPGLRHLASPRSRRKLLFCLQSSRSP